MGDKLVGTFTILWPNMGAQIGQSSGSTYVVNLQPNFLPKIKIFSGKPEEGWNFTESFKLKSSKIYKKSAIADFVVSVSNMAVC